MVVSLITDQGVMIYLFCTADISFRIIICPDPFEKSPAVNGVIPDNFAFSVVKQLDS
ncbi:hypothetical protein DSECCO2_648480 [anaerobic digester metagenome]